MIEDGPIDTSALDDADPPITNETPILSEDAPASEDPFERTCGSFDWEAVQQEDNGDPPITELDIRMIVHGLHDQGCGHVLADMVEGATGARPPDDTYSPRKMPIRDLQWRAARRKAERQKYRTERRARMTDEEKAKQIGNLQLWKANNPEKMRAAETRRLQKEKADRKSRDFAAVDLEGFDTGKYYTDDRPDYVRELHEGIARGLGEHAAGQKELDTLLRDHIVISEEERLAQQVPFAGWTVHNGKWYRDQHDLTCDPVPSARNKLPGTPPIYIEHRPFLLGVGNDHYQYFLTEEMPASAISERFAPEGTGAKRERREVNSLKKIPLSGAKSLNAIADLRKVSKGAILVFKDSIFVTFAFGYDVAQILRCLDADTAGKLQAGEIVIKSVDDDGAPCEEVIEQAVFFWNEFAISYRRGIMFRVGRLNDPANVQI